MKYFYRSISNLNLVFEIFMKGISQALVIIVVIVVVVVVVVVVVSHCHHYRCRFVVVASVAVELYYICW